jgi:hypothetical protein
MLTVQQAAYEGKLFIVEQMIDKDPSLVNSFDQVSQILLIFILTENNNCIIIIGWS